ncbi:MAG: hypothetical protein ACO2OO_01430 [Candidatus Aenigmatarchaeota archaeon]
MTKSRSKLLEQNPLLQRKILDLYTLFLQNRSPITDTKSNGKKDEIGKNKTSCTGARSK